MISKTRWRRWWAESIPGKPPHKWKLAWLQTLFLSPFWKTPSSKPFWKNPLISFTCLSSPKAPQKYHLQKIPLSLSVAWRSPPCRFFFFSLVLPPSLANLPHSSRISLSSLPSFLSGSFSLKFPFFPENSHSRPSKKQNPPKKHLPLWKYLSGQPGPPFLQLACYPITACRSPAYPPIRVAFPFVHQLH